MNFQVGSLVRARGREWVVQPESDGDWLILRPLGGTEAETAGIFLPLEGEDVQPATFEPPDPAQPGDFISGRLLRDAVRLGFRSSAGPFRSFARIAVEPRPYQLVPLLMALKLDPVRLLIADDVGIGKTIEAGLIARELLDRGEVGRLAVICPPQLAEQWQKELAQKFHIEAELVLPSTVTRLERNLAVGQSLFDVFPFTIVSLDYIKSSRRRDEFIRSAPELIIFDEAHAVAFNPDKRSGRHLRNRLARELAADQERHLILATATPHSGDEGAFRSLLTLLRPDFADLPQDLSGRENEGQRREVARHMVQRRRGDVKVYMEQDTAFPARKEAEASYELTPDYGRLFDTVLEYARERVLDESGGRLQQRVRWWSALALLRSLASSPAAAAYTLRNRSGTAATASAKEADEVGERTVLDLDDAESSEFMDVAPGGQEGEEDGDSTERERLLRYARRAEALSGPEKDAKLAQAMEIVKGLLDEGYSPILFCRFIPTAEYVAEQLREALPRTVEVAAITGNLPPAGREARVEALGEHEKRVLVATDCLSEGINLQQHFNAVMHYDLSWNPTRHEQREGRVDRFGQQARTIRTVTYYGVDNKIDGIVLEILLRKHKSIRSSLGISVPIPRNSGDVAQALMEGLILRGREANAQQLAFDFMTEDEEIQRLHLEWEAAKEREKRSRTMFAQHRIKVEEVAREWQAMRDAVGTGVDVQRFMREAVKAHEGYVEEGGSNGAYPVWEFHLPNKAAVKEAVLGIGNTDGAKFKARFKLPAADGVRYLSRTHPYVEGLAGFVMDSALDPLLSEGAVAKRSGVVRTGTVKQATTLLLLRFRFHIETKRRSTTGREEESTPMLAEDVQVVGFTGSPGSPDWLDEERAEELLQSRPGANVSPQQATAFLQRTIDSLAQLQDGLNEMAEERAQELLDAHRRVRVAGRMKGISHRVRPQLPVDVLGVYMLLPA